MARNPKKASKGKRAKKGKIQDLPAGRKAKNVKGGIILQRSGTLTSSSLISDSYSK